MPRGEKGYDKSGIFQASSTDVTRVAGNALFSLITEHFKKEEAELNRDRLKDT